MSRKTFRFPPSRGWVVRLLWKAGRLGTDDAESGLRWVGSGL